MTQEELARAIETQSLVAITRLGIRPTPSDVGVPRRSFRRLVGNSVRTYVELVLRKSGKVHRAPLSRLRSLEAATC